MTEPEKTGRFGAVTVGGFSVEAELGRSSLGAIYRARQERLQRMVALKVLDPHLAQDEKQVKQFLREARGAARLRHPNVVALHDVGTCPDSGLHFIAMEYVEGGTLVELIQREGALEEDWAFDILEGLLGALGAAHEAGIIHRDVKPANVLITRAGAPKLTHLGLAKREGADSLTSVSNLLGSAHYIAPELALKLSVDGRCDLYSLGISLFQMLTGQLPFEGESFYAIAERHMNEDVADPRAVRASVSAAAATIVAGLCARLPDDRYASAADAEQDVRRLKAGREPIGPRGTPSGGTSLALKGAASAAAAAGRGGPAGEQHPFEVYAELDGEVLARQICDQDRVVVGRAVDCDVILDNPIVSRRHAEIRREGLTLSLSPLSRTNATVLNEEKLSETILLSPGDLIVLSDHVTLRVAFVGDSSDDEATEVPAGPKSFADLRAERGPDQTLRAEDEAAPARDAPRLSDESDLGTTPASYGAGARTLEEASAPALASSDGVHEVDATDAPTAMAFDARKATANATPGEGALVYLKSGSWTRLDVGRGLQIGAGSSCDVRLAEGSPRKVAIVVPIEDDYVLWAVAQDADVVLLNGEPVQDQVILEKGDQIFTGGVELTFVIRAVNGEA